MTVLASLKRLLPQSELRTALSASRQALRDLRERQIRTLQLYVTNRCNSRCLHCYVWTRRPHVDLPVAKVAEVLQAGCLAPGADICLEGGEFTLHPEYLEILALFAGRPVCLITNGLLPERLAPIAEGRLATRVLVSLDGGPDTYRRLRGVDAYDKAVESIRLLKERVKVAVNFTFTPWNGAADHAHVKALCAELGVEMGLPGLYTAQPYFKTAEPPSAIAGKHEAVETADAFQRRYLDAHDSWLRGETVLPCFSIFRSALVYPEGDVFFCHARQVLLGNLHQASLDAIWTGEHTRRSQDAYLSCNACWCSYHRLQDVYAEPLGRALMLQRRLVSRTSWAGPAESTTSASSGLEAKGRPAR